MPPKKSKKKSSKAPSKKQIKEEEVPEVDDQLPDIDNSFPSQTSFRKIDFKFLTLNQLNSNPQKHRAKLYYWRTIHREHCELLPRKFLKSSQFKQLKYLRSFKDVTKQSKRYTFRTNITYGDKLVYHFRRFRLLTSLQIQLLQGHVPIKFTFITLRKMKNLKNLHLIEGFNNQAKKQLIMQKALQLVSNSRNYSKLVFQSIIDSRRPYEDGVAYPCIQKLNPKCLQRLAGYTSDGLKSLSWEFDNSIKLQLEMDKYIKKSNSIQNLCYKLHDENMHNQQNIDQFAIDSLGQGNQQLRAVHLNFSCLSLKFKIDFVKISQHLNELKNLESLQFTFNYEQAGCPILPANAKFEQIKTLGIIYDDPVHIDTFKMVTLGVEMLNNRFENIENLKIVFEMGKGNSLMGHRIAEKKSLKALEIRTAFIDDEAGPFFAGLKEKTDLEELCFEFSRLDHNRVKTTPYIDYFNLVRRQTNLKSFKVDYGGIKPKLSKMTMEPFLCLSGLEFGYYWFSTNKLDDSMQKQFIKWVKELHYFKVFVLEFEISLLGDDSYVDTFAEEIQKLGNQNKKIRHFECKRIKKIPIECSLNKQRIHC